MNAQRAIKLIPLAVAMSDDNRALLKAAVQDPANLVGPLAKFAPDQAEWKAVFDFLDVVAALTIPE